MYYVIIIIIIIIIIYHYYASVYVVICKTRVHDDVKSSATAKLYIIALFSKLYYVGR